MALRFLYRHVERNEVQSKHLGALAPHKASPVGAIPPQNGGNVGNAVGIEQQKGGAARKRSWRALARLKRIVFIICNPCFCKAEFKNGRFLSSIGFYSRCSQNPLRLCGGRTLSVSLQLPPLPIQWESLPRLGKAFILIAFRCGTSCLDPSSAEQVSASQDDGRNMAGAENEGESL